MQITHKIITLPALFALALSLSLGSKLVSAQTLDDVTNTSESLLFSVHGSNTIGAHLAPSWAMQYLTDRGVTDVIIQDRAENETRVEGHFQQRKVYIDIYAHGSSTGFKAMQQGKADIAMASRAVKESENSALSKIIDMRDQQHEHVVAIDGLAIIVNQQNRVSSLTLSQLRQIFSGKIKNWSQVGGEDATITLHARDEKSGTWDTFKSLVLDSANPLSREATRFESNDELAKLVSRQRHAIGFVALASVNQVKPLAISDGKSLKLSPQHLTIATEDYPLSRRLYMYTKPGNGNSEENVAAQDFIEFTKSQRGQEIVEHIGFISQNPLSISDAVPEEGPQGYARLVEKGQRLSINFRFETGSAELDNKAKQDIHRLAEYMRLPENQNKRLQLIGFGDFKQRETLALAFSKLRALAVKSALHKEGVSVEPVKGFGSYLPVASNEGDNKVRNQRVEVWLFDGDHEIYQQSESTVLSSSDLSI